MAIDQNKFEDKLTIFIHNLIGKEVTSTTSLFSDNLLDSLKILDLIAFVESELRIDIPDEKITGKHFKDIRAISESFFISRETYAKSSKKK
jgi:acyl carrier protein